MRTRKRINALTYLTRIRLAPALLLSIVAASAHAGSNALPNADGSRISVTAVAGHVDFTMAGNAIEISPNDTVLLPARIVTGRDGNVSLAQAGTKVIVANDSDVEIPAEAVDGNLIARLVQRRGNVFYDVAPRDLGKLRVETPFLVAVIKGTQFNVAVDDNGTTISLFEGRLEIHAPDDTDVFDLNAGEIAIRSLIDDSIRIIGMNDPRVAIPPPLAADETAPVAPQADAPSVTVADAAGDAPANSSDGTATRADTSGVTSAASVAVASPPAAELAIGVGTDERPTYRRNDDADVGRPLDVGIDRGRGVVDNRGQHVGQNSVDVGLNTSVAFDGTFSIDAVIGSGADLVPGIDVGPGLDLSVDTRLLDLPLGPVDELELDVDVGGDTSNLAVDLTVDSGRGAQKPEPSRGVHGRVQGASNQL